MEQNLPGETIATFGELMLRLDCAPTERLQKNYTFRKFFGGAEANVAVVLSQLGVNARFISALPENDLGQSAIYELNSLGIDTRFVHRSRDRMGIYITEHGNEIRPSRVIYDRKHSAFAQLAPGIIDWAKALDGASVFYWSGISVALTEHAAAACREGILAAVAKNIPVAADMNYRSMLWDYGVHPSQVMPELLSHCQTVTGDLNTLRIYFGIEVPDQLNSDEQFKLASEGLRKKLPAMNAFAMSFRGKDTSGQPTYHGALMKEGKFFFSPVYSLPHVVDRIGSGDAMQGGLQFALLRQMPPQEVINFAIACGVLKHSMEGDFTILSKHEVLEFIKSGPQSRVIR